MKIKFLKWYESMDKDENGDLILGRKFMNINDIKAFQAYYKLVIFMNTEVKIKDAVNFKPDYNTNLAFNVELSFKEDDRDYMLGNGYYDDATREDIYLYCEGFKFSPESLKVIQKKLFKYYKKGYGMWSEVKFKDVGHFNYNN